MTEQEWLEEAEKSDEEKSRGVFLKALKVDPAGASELLSNHLATFTSDHCEFFIAIMEERHNEAMELLDKWEQQLLATHYSDMEE